MRSASLLILLEGWELNVGLDRRRPKSLASAESLAFKVCAEETHLEFFRMAEVTASISEYKTCFCETGPAAVACSVAEAMMDLRECSKENTWSYKRLVEAPSLRVFFSSHFLSH